jgi:hypothetical protein
MRKKFCTLHNKTVYAKICLECGKLGPTKEPIKKRGAVFGRLENGRGLLEVAAEYETPGWECEHLFEKVVFKGPYTDAWRKRFNELPEPPVGTMEKYQYSQQEIDAYSV